MQMMKLNLVILLALTVLGCARTSQVSARVRSDGRSELVAVANGDGDAILLEFAALHDLLAKHDITLSVAYSMGMTQANVWQSDAPLAKQIIRRAVTSGELNISKDYFGHWWKE